MWTGGAYRPFLHDRHFSAASTFQIIHAIRCATILRTTSGNGRCSALASSHGARIQTSHSSSVVKMTGISRSPALT
jgi:hypothetical protein